LTDVFRLNGKLLWINRNRRPPLQKRKCCLCFSGADADDVESVRHSVRRTATAWSAV